MKVRVGACALLVCLAGCTADKQDARIGGQWSAATGKAQEFQRLTGVQSVRSPAKSIANAPDRGALITYKNQGNPSKQEGAYTWFPIELSEAHALRAAVTGILNVPAPDGSQVRVKYERHIEHPDGNWTWIGRVIGGDQKQEAILTFGQDAVYGSIPQAVGAPLSLQTRGGSLFAIKTDLSKVKTPNVSASDMMVPPALALRQSLLSQPAAKAQIAQASVEGKATPATTIDVAIGYSAGFATAQGSASAAVTRLNFLIDVGNQAFTNSQITGALRLVNTVQVAYADTTSNQTALGELTGNNGSGPVTVPASLAPLRTARDQYGADLAVLVRKFEMPENDGCGIAWLNGSGQTPITPATDAAYGFAVVSDGNDTNNGNSYFCAPETLVHELGHLMGSAHDRDNSKINASLPAGGSNLLYGRYAYSFGMKTSAANGNFYTIMAYGDDNQNFYRTFSNPLVLKCGPSNNLACGVTDQTDNARSLNQTIPVVATFRQAVVPFADQLDLYSVFKMGASNFTEVFPMDGANNFSRFSYGAATSLARTGADKSWNFQFADYNGDGKPDLYTIFKVGASNTTEVHVLSGADRFKTFLVHTTTALQQTGSDNRWMFKVGDYNKDGKPDIYAILRTGASGKTEIHVLNGADNYKTYLTHTATVLASTGTDYAWEFALGDYNGDGTLDLYTVFKNGGSGKTEVHVLNGATNFQTYLTNTASVLYATGSSNVWNFKVGDYNRDGKLDIYAIYKQGASGKTEVFVMNGADNFQTYLASISTALYSTGTDLTWEFELAPPT